MGSFRDESLTTELTESMLSQDVKATEKKRKYEQQHIVLQITSAKQDLATQNVQLVLLHGELNQTYAALSSKQERHSKHDMDALHTKYTQQSQIYYKQYSRFNDLTADIVTLQQKLHRLLLAPSTGTVTAHSQSTPHTDQTMYMKGDNVCDEFDKSSSPSSPSFTLLPPIMESDGECAEWKDDDECDSMHLPEQVCHMESDKKERLDEHAFDDPTQDKAMPTALPDYLKLEGQINLMLDNIWNADIQSICQQFRDFVYAHSAHCKTIEILINCIIIHAVNNKPVFFGGKYSLLCQSIFADCIQLRGSSKLNDITLYELIWCCCYETFRKLQFGNNSEKFINIMIIIAELANAKLLPTAHIFGYIFKGILCKNNAEEVCENDIEGIYEIFKRCAASLTCKSNHNELEKYFMIMNNIKTWRKFQNGINRVPFMINEMQTISNNYIE